MSDRRYLSVHAYGPNFCEHEGCSYSAKHVVGFEEDMSYRYMDRWVKSHVYDEAYFCDEHLPAEARALGAS